MSATINSNQGSTVTTTHAWTGEANASPSVQSVQGFERRRNRIPNPLNGQSIQGVTGTRVSISAGTDYARATITDATSVALAQRLQLGSNIAGTYAIPVVAGESLPFSLELRSSSAQPMGIQLRWFDATDATISTDTVSTAILVSSSAFTRFEATVVPPSGAVRVWVYVGTGTGARAVGDTFDVRRVFFGDLGSYFDGSTATKTETIPDTTKPTLILGYETARRSQNLYHDVLGGGQDVTLRPAALRSGTLRLFYPSEADAAAAMTMHAKAALFYVSDPDRPSITMYYAVDGTLALELDAGRNVWTLAVGYQEVTP